MKASFNRFVASTRVEVFMHHFDRFLRAAIALLVCGWFALCLFSSGCARAADEMAESAIEPQLARARAFADGLNLNVAQLEAHDPPIAGKKKLAELLDLYLLLLRRESSDTGRSVILARIDSLTSQVRTPGYQNLSQLGPDEFDASALSYLRVYVLLQRVHLFTQRDREQIEGVKNLLDASIARRGAWQREMFGEYYRRLGLELPPTLSDSTDSDADLAQGSAADSLAGARFTTVISRRIPFTQFNLQRAYALTHEVFVAFDYGQKKEQKRFDAGDLQYLRSVLVPLQQLTVKKKSLDLLAEVLSCRAYLGFTQDPSYQQAYALILASQNKNGSWGDYEQHRSVYGDTLEVEGYLHTTLVCVQALIDVSERS
jgi:hypothetical protein